MIDRDRELCTKAGDRRNKIAHEADLDQGNPGERWPIDRPLVEDAIDFIESTIRVIYEVAGLART